MQLTLELSRALIGFPRHLSQHPGGIIITRGRLDELCPVENAAMAERTLIAWDKDDIEALGMPPDLSAACPRSAHAAHAVACKAVRG